MPALGLAIVALGAILVYAGIRDLALGPLFLGRQVKASGGGLLG